MEIKLREVTIRELTEGYQDNADDGVVGFGGKLNIRPPYQREFVYSNEKRDKVIDTVLQNFPLNVMYWAENDDGTFEIIDGQQRTISICQYVYNIFSMEIDDRPMNFYNCNNDIQQKILDYKLMVYFCKGTDTEKLKWFETINIAGEKLTNQELLNAVYSGSWVTDAKKSFSKNGCRAYGMGNKYLTGSPIRQDYLETAIKWISGGKIAEYMSEHQNDPSSIALWNYFQSVISWTEATFIKYRKEMKGIEWGDLYNQFKDEMYDPKELEERIKKLMEDDDVTAKKGIYKYILTGDTKYLSIRSFTTQQKREQFEKQEGKCPSCKKFFDLQEMEADHITPWSQGGRTDKSNCQMLCRECNRRKSNI